MRTAFKSRFLAPLALASVCALMMGACGSDPATSESELVTVTAMDTPNDAGHSLSVSWTEFGGREVTDYVVFASASADGEFVEVGRTLAIAHELVLDERENGEDTYFRVDAVSPGETFQSEVAGPVAASAQWFNSAKTWGFILGFIVCFFVIMYIQMARKGRELFIRKIAGLEAIDEAIGRATEMGRPILFVPGIMDMDNVQTLAGLAILGYVSKKVAEYDTEINVPVSRSLVMTAGREIVKQAYMEAGRPDAYNDNMVHYLTDEQFGYVAGVNGIIVRDEPATCFYQGAFYAESLILAETGNSMGAIQIAGTAMPSQLPFFVAACDYTLIGEELFAASAYMSNDPQQLGSLKGQDVGKGIAMAAIAVGSLIATLAVLTAPGGDICGEHDDGQAIVCSDGLSCEAVEIDGLDEAQQLCVPAEPTVFQSALDTLVNDIF